MKILTDRTIFFLVRDAGLVPSQYGFSQLCGRHRSWFSTIAAQGMEMSIAALGTLAANIALHAEAEPDGNRRAHLLALHGRLLEELGRRCRARAMAARCDAQPSTKAV